MEMGTGKTLTTIAIEGALYNIECIRRVLVVSPLSVTGVWKDEHDAYADFNYTLPVLKGSGEKKLDTLRHMIGAIYGLQHYPDALFHNYFDTSYKITIGIDFYIADHILTYYN